MTALENSPRILRGIALVGLLSALTFSQGFAQGFPQQQPPIGSAPVQLVPPDALDPSSSNFPPPGGGPIQINDLGNIEPNSLGTLNGTNGGFGVKMWKGATRDLIAKLLPQLPGRSGSPAMHDLMRRLLLTSAAAPNIAPGSGEKGENLLPTRLKLLVRMGETRAALRLIDMLPPKLINEPVHRARVEALLVEGELDQACVETRVAIGAYESAYWQKTFIFCQLRNKEEDRARLGVDLLRESGHKDPAFFAAADAMLGQRKLSVSGLSDPTPLQVVMLAFSAKALPEDVISNGSPAILRTVALSESVTPELRAKAAEKAIAVNILEPEYIATLYSSFEFTQGEFLAPLTEATLDKGIHSRALLFLAAGKEKRPAGKAEIIGQALDLAAKEGLFVASAKILSPMLLEMKPTVPLSWFSGRAARALYAAGRPIAAKQWVTLAKDNSYTTSDTAIAAATLWPLARLAEYQWDRPWPAGGLRDWNEAQHEVSEGIAARRRAVLLNLFTAFGEPLDATEWEELLGYKPLRTTSVPSAALWHGLDLSSKTERVGQTLLMSLIAMGDKGPAGAAAITLQHIITNLRRVGLDTEARQLALEAALASGA